MSSGNIKRAARLFAGAMAMSAIASAMLAVPAQAELSCNEYTFPKEMRIEHGDLQITLNVTAELTSTFVGNAQGKNRVAPYVTLKGTAIGKKLERGNVDFDIFWKPNGTVAVHYTGDIAADKLAYGQAEDRNNPSRVGRWRSTDPFVCATPPAPVTPAQPLGPPKQLGKDPLRTVTVAEDVDVYDRPNTDENDPARKLGVLDSEDGTATVRVQRDCKPESWCKVTGDNVPGGTGFVWGHLSLD